MDRLKWIIALIAAILVTGAVEAALQNHSYMPVVWYNEPFTPTVTLTPTVTPTPTSTKTPTSGLQITEIEPKNSDDPLDEYIAIKNFGSSSVNMTGWFLRDDGLHRYDFPNNFRLAGSATVKVWTKAGNDSSSNLYWNSPVEVWNNGGDCGYLRDDSDGDNILVDVLCYKASADGMLIIIRDH